MKKILIIALLAITLSNCREDATSATQQGNFKVEFLFEQDGCKMYRFQDGSARTVYWANCQGRIQSDYETHAGKNHTTHREETIITE